jgi:hypothetical protein
MVSGDRNTAVTTSSLPTFRQMTKHRRCLLLECFFMTYISKIRLERHYGFMNDGITNACKSLITVGSIRRLTGLISSPDRMLSRLLIEVPV